MEEEVRLTIQIVDPLNKARFTTHQLVPLSAIATAASETAERMAQPFRKTRKPKLVKRTS